MKPAWARPLRPPITFMLPSPVGFTSNGCPSVPGPFGRTVIQRSPGPSALKSVVNTSM